MLILNAPGFFSMAWGLIKKFIDPQTASRISVCSGSKQGFQALENVIDITQIPKDYGGSNISIAEAFRNEANDPLLLRQCIELVHVKRKSKATSNPKKQQEWTLQPGEYVDLNCYTRSSSGASLTISLNGTPHKTIDQVKCEFDVEGRPKAVCHRLADRLVGWTENGGSPTVVSIEVSDLDNANKKHHKESRGYFLMVGDIKKA